jgi:hypothetical protein
MGLHLLCRFDLGVGFRVRYGDLLKGFRDLPVWRTTSQGQYTAYSSPLNLVVESAWIFRTDARFSVGRCLIFDTLSVDPFTGYTLPRGSLVSRITNRNIINS